MRHQILALAALLGAAVFVPAAPRIASELPLRGVRKEPAAHAVTRWSDIPADAGIRASRPRKPIDERRPDPNRAIPPGAPVRIESTSAVTASRAVALPASPEPSASFAALPDDGTTEPPDTHGAVGRSHLMVTLNSQVRVQDRAGTALSTVSLAAFWAPVSGGDPFDPRILYDPLGDRWITVAIGNFYRSLLLGVSRSGDPTGRWDLYRIDPAPSDRVDFPVVSFSTNRIVVANSWLTVEGGTWTWRGSQYRVFDKADLYGGGRGLFTLIPVIGGGPDPGVTLDPEEPALYLLQGWSGNTDGNGVLRLSTITGPIGSEVLTPVTFIATPNPWSSDPPGGDLAGCPQLGESQKMPCFGGFQPVFRNGTIWAAHIVWLPADAPTRSAVQWWQITLDGEVLQRGRLDDPTGVRFYGFPSLAVNRNGDVLLGFASFSAQQFPSGGYAYRAAGDPPGALRSERVLKAGEDIYLGHPDGHGARWGDYSATVVDPSNDTDLWTIQEYAAARDAATGASRWGTWWGRIVPAAGAIGRPPPEAPARARTPRALPPRGQ